MTVTEAAASGRGEMKPRLLDLFCGAGGAGTGYARAGFEVVGVDLIPQPRYPFPFLQNDALQVLRMLAAGGSIGPSLPDGRWFTRTDFAAIHASPPCQGYSRSRFTPGSQGRAYPMLLDEVREVLRAIGRTWVVENARESPLAGFELCGTMFGLRVRRHRAFEASFYLLAPGGCRHSGSDLGIYAGKVTRLGSRATAYVAASGRTHYRPALAPLVEGRAAMGIDWMDRHELSQAIPPAYTRFIGRRLMEHLQGVPS